MAAMLTLAALAADPDHFHLIDVRDAEDFAAAHVAGAGQIPLSELADRAGELPAGRTPVTICGKGGGRSAEGANILSRLGRPDALWADVRGGDPETPYRGNALEPLAVAPRRDVREDQR